MGCFYGQVHFWFNISAYFWAYIFWSYSSFSILSSIPWKDVYMYRFPQLIQFISNSTALPLRHAEQRLSGGPCVYRQSQSTSCHQTAWARHTEWWEGALAAHRETSWQVGVLVDFSSVSYLFFCNYNLFSTLCVFAFVCTRSFAVQVDEEAKRQAALPNDQPINLQRIFLGGIPAEVEQLSSRANVPFQGCIWNLMINAVYVKLTEMFENSILEFEILL